LSKNKIYSLGKYWEGEKERNTSHNTTITASEARLADHDEKTEKSNHEVYAPTAMDLSAVAPGLLGPK